MKANGMCFICDPDVLHERMKYPRSKSTIVQTLKAIPDLDTLDLAFEHYIPEEYHAELLALLCPEQKPPPVKRKTAPSNISTASLDERWAPGLAKRQRFQAEATKK